MPLYTHNTNKMWIFAITNIIDLGNDNKNSRQRCKYPIIKITGFQ